MISPGSHLLPSIPGPRPGTWRPGLICAPRASSTLLSRTLSVLGGSPVLRTLTVLPFISPPRKMGVQAFSSNPFSQIGAHKALTLTLHSSLLPFSLAQGEGFYQAPSLRYCDASFM